MNMNMMFIFMPPPPQFVSCDLEMVSEIGRMKSHRSVTQGRCPGE